MAWRDWVRTVEVEPSLYAADFARLGEQIDELLDAGVRVFHYDVGDGHFVEPITIGPIVLESIAEPIHARGGAIDVHLMVDNPERHIPQVARAGGDSVTFHVEVTDEPAALIALAREHGLGAGVAFNPQTEVARAAAAAEGADLCLCMSINPGYSGQRFMPEALPRIRELRGLLPPRRVRPGRRRRRRRERPRGQGCRRRAARRGQRRLRARRPAGVVPGPRPGADVSLERALELAAAAPGQGLPEPDRRRRRRRGRRGRRRGRHRGARRPPRGGRRARRGRRAGPRRHALPDDGAVHPPRAHAAVRRPGARGRDREGRRGLARPEPGGRRRARAAARGGGRGRARGLARGAAAERGVAHLGRARPAVRHLQGGGDARRPRDRARLALGDRGGEPPPRPRAPRRLGRGRRRHGHRSAPTRRGSTPATSP